MAFSEKLNFNSKSLETPQMNLCYGRIRNLVGGFKALHDVCKKQAPGHCSVLQTLLSCPGPQEGLKILVSNIGQGLLYRWTEHSILLMSTGGRF